MPGPCSTPKAKDPTGRIIKGKSALKRAGLKSGEGMKPQDYREL